MLNNRNTQQGTILPVLLVMLMIISVLIAGVVSMAEQQTAQLQQQRTILNARTELHNTLEILRYSLLTRPYNEGGLVTDLATRRTDNPLLPLPPLTGTELRMDNTLYNGWGDSAFTLQDADSLLNLNSAEAEQLSSLLLQADISPPETRTALITRLNDYRQAVYPNPAKNPLTTVRELHDLPEWEDTELLENPLFYDNVSTIGRGFFNINTSPAAVVQAYTNLTTEKLTRLLSNRPYQNSVQISTIAGGRLDFPIEYIVYLASKHFRIRLYHPDLNYYEELFISFSLKEEDGHPWIIESALRLPAAGAPDPETAQDTGLRFFDPAYLEFYAPF